jgi:hypothetical protein
LSPLSLALLNPKTYSNPPATLNVRNLDLSVRGNRIYETPPRFRLDTATYSAYRAYRAHLCGAQLAAALGIGRSFAPKTENPLPGGGFSPQQDEYHPVEEARCSINYLSTLSTLSILLGQTTESLKHASDRKPADTPRLGLFGFLSFHVHAAGWVLHHSDSGVPKALGQSPPKSSISGCRRCLPRGGGAMGRS